MKDKHRTYVQQLTDLSDREGKRISAAALNDVAKMLKLARGNPDAFVMLIGNAKTSRAKKLKELGMKAIKNAATIGKAFGREKGG